MQSVLYNLKMRAAQGGAHEQGGKHISGAERIVSANELLYTVSQLVERAQNHERGYPDFININIESINIDAITEIASLPVYSLKSHDKKESYKLVYKILKIKGINEEIVQTAFKYLLDGPAADGGNMRGAILMDINNGNRLEPDFNKGIRVTGMDYDPFVKEDLAYKLERLGLNNAHVREALCLASKVSSVPGIIAELCWSDDPSYTTGYVAVSGIGYIRLENMKDKGSEQGGRVFFLDPEISTVEDVINSLEKETCLITRLGSIYEPMTWDSFIKLRKD